MRDLEPKQSKQSKQLKQPRITVIAEQLRRESPGGIGRYTTALVRALHDLGVSTDVVLSAGPRPADLPSDVDTITTRLAHRATTELWQRGFLGISVRRDTDVVHATSFHSPRERALTDTYRRSRPRPVRSVFVHDAPWRNYPQFFSRRGVAFHERSLRRLSQESGPVLVPSQRVADGLCSMKVIESRRLFVVGEGADHLPPASQPLTRVRPFLLTVSTQEPRKNLEALVGAYATWREQRRGAVPDLVIAGMKGWGAVNVGRGDGIELCGAVTDQELANLYSAASGFVYVPFEEGYGLPPLEALRAGVPLICSDAVPSITEAPSTAEGHGFEAPAIVVRPDDGAALVRALDVLAFDESKRDELRLRGLEHVSGLTWQNAALRHLDAWMSVL